MLVLGPLPQLPPIGAVRQWPCLTPARAVPGAQGMGIYAILTITRGLRSAADIATKARSASHRLSTKKVKLPVRIFRKFSRSHGLIGRTSRNSGIVCGEESLDAILCVRINRRAQAELPLRDILISLISHSCARPFR